MATIIELSSDSEPEVVLKRTARPVPQQERPRVQKASFKPAQRLDKHRPIGVVVNGARQSLLRQDVVEGGHKLGSEAGEGINRREDPLRRHTEAKQDHSSRVTKFNGYHEKEAARRRTLPASKEREARTPDDREVRHEVAVDKRPVLPQNGSHTNTSTPKTPIFSGAGLSILDLPSHLDNGVPRAVQHPKRVAAPSPTLDRGEPIPKRQRVAEAPRLPESQQPASHVPQRIPESKDDDFTEDVSQQLESELVASVPRPQRSVRLSAVGSSEVLPDQAKTHTAPDVSKQKQNLTPLTGRHRTIFTDAEDALLAKLKEIDNLGWKEIHAYFPTRTSAGLQTRYSNKLKRRSLGAAHQANVYQPIVQQSKPQVPDTSRELSAGHENYQAPTRRKQRGGGKSVQTGFVSWSQASKQAFEELEPQSAAEDEAAVISVAASRAGRDRVNPSSMSRLLRSRELYGSDGRSWVAVRTLVPEELKNHVLSEYRPRKYFTSTSGDVASMAWAPDGERFTVGSIAISDDRSMQYNSSLNLLLGNSQTSALKELPEHHIPRPVIDADSGNVNGEHAMRESQDSRLFMTVAAVAFSRNGKRVYSAGSDQKVRMYRVGEDIHEARCRYEIYHPAVVDLMTVGNHGLLATGCHSSADGSIQVYDCKRQSYDLKLSLSPSRIDVQSGSPLFPSALKWGVAPQHSSFLLAGFSGDSPGQTRETAGETALWNVETGLRVRLSTVTRNVFDVAWNPSPSPASSSFAVASTPSTKTSYGQQSVIQLYAPGQDGARQVLGWDCPAVDINDVMYCPFDDNMIAAGATNGRVYLWDKRFADRNQKPLHTLAHGDSVNVLDHNLHTDISDTGVRFLSWGATSSRIYSGSSDGVVKVWNPYRSGGNALVKDAATFQTAIMSGAFSPDHRDLLIGEECGRINLLSVDLESNEDDDGGTSAPAKFKLHPAPEPLKLAASPFAAAKDLVQSEQIVFRPMGALPIRQAVCGPKYNGPWLKPTRDQWTLAKDECERARVAQNEAQVHEETVSSQPEVASSQLEPAEMAAKDATTRLRSARLALDRGYFNTQKKGAYSLRPL
ncbi:hypothetical protein LTR08_007800 [Meristemomyces frigidus]|nr:hypothetical protein LTR08_007800 [Meristemomyces frigidus]